MNNWSIKESTEFKTEDDKLLYFKDEINNEIYNAIINKNCDHNKIIEIERCKKCSREINNIKYIRARKIYNKDRIMIERPIYRFKLLNSEMEYKIYYRWDEKEGKIFMDENNNILFTYDDYGLYDRDEEIKYVIIIHKDCYHKTKEEIKKCDKCSIEINKCRYGKGYIKEYNRIIDVKLDICYSRKI